MAMTNATANNDTSLTLYERLGGTATMNLMVSSFYDELLEEPILAPFFQNASFAALKTHMVKLFECLCGPPEEQPDPRALLEYMLRTHTRLFREGLTERHFDILATCFVQCLQTFQLEQSLMDEFVAKLAALRIVFEYGGKLAKQEEEMPAEQLEKLPQASARTIGTDQVVKLPVIHYIDVPEWLPKALLSNHNHADTKYTADNIVQAWTCALTDRFGMDPEIADTYMDQPYLDHHIYTVALLQLAFLPQEDDVDTTQTRKTMLDIVLFPRGEKCAPLSKHLLDRMIVEFALVGNQFGMSKYRIEQAQEKLRSHRGIFASKTLKVGGATRPHVLSKKKAPIPEEEELQQQKRKHHKKKHSKHHKRRGSHTHKAPNSPPPPKLVFANLVHFSLPSIHLPKMDAGGLMMDDTSMTTNSITTDDTSMDGSSTFWRRNYNGSNSTLEAITNPLKKLFVAGNTNTTKAAVLPQQRGQK